MKQLVLYAHALIARFGGEEIAIILPGTESAVARKLAEYIYYGVKQLRIPFSTPERSDGFITVFGKGWAGACGSKI